MKSVASAFPALVAVVLGVCIYVGYLPPWLGMVAVICGAVAAISGRLLLRHCPVLASRLICFWIFCGIGVMAYLTAALLWLGLNVPSFFPNVDEATLKEVTSAVTGAAATFAGVIITKDMEEGRGYFWPGALFQKGIQKVFGSGPQAPAGGSRPWEAVFENRVGENGPTGWGCRACVARAKILREHLKTL